MMTSLPVRWLLLRVSQTLPCRWWHHHPRTISWPWLVQVWRCSSWWGSSAADSPNVSLRSWRTGRPRPLWGGQDTPTGEMTTAEKNPPPRFTASILLTQHTPPAITGFTLPTIQQAKVGSISDSPALLWHEPRPLSKKPHPLSALLSFFLLFLQNVGSSCSLTPHSPDLHAVLPPVPPPFAVGVGMRRGRCCKDMESGEDLGVREVNQIILSVNV